MLKKIGVCIVCSLLLMCSACKADIITEEEAQQKKKNEAEHVGNSVYIKCVKGYWVVTYNGGGAFQLFETVHTTDIPQPMRCEK